MFQTRETSLLSPALPNSSLKTGARARCAGRKAADEIGIVALHEPAKTRCAARRETRV